MRGDFTSMAAIGTGAFLGLVGTAALFASGMSHDSHSESCITARSLAPEIIASVEASVSPNVAVTIQRSGQTADGEAIGNVIVRAPRPAVTAEVAEAPEAPEAPHVATVVEVPTIRNAIVISEDVSVQAECVVEVAEMRERIEEVRVRTRRDADELRAWADRMRAEADEVRAEYQSDEFRTMVEELRADALENGEVDADQINAVVERAMAEMRARMDDGGNEWY